MSGPTRKVSAATMQMHGEDYLSDLEEIVLVLENAKVVRLKLAGELEIPTDPDALRTAAERGPGRVAFWTYQMERAGGRVRDLERELAKLEAETSLIYGKYLKEEDERVTDSVLRSRVDIDDHVSSKRKELSDAKTAYGYLRATCGAIEHRMYVLRKLLTSDSDATRA
jgi:hypothetical protein